MNSGSSAFIFSGAHSVGRLGHLLVYQKVSRPACMSQGSSVIIATMHVLDARGLLQRLVGDGLQRDVLAGAQRDVGGDEQLALRVVDAVAERVGAEAAEDDGWIAPIRVQASIAIGSSGIIGM